MTIIHDLADNFLFKGTNSTLGTVSMEQSEQEEALCPHWMAKTMLGLMVG